MILWAPAFAKEFLLTCERIGILQSSAAKPQPKSFSKKQEVDREWYTWTEPLINTVALARWKDALSTGKLFQQFVNRRSKPASR